MSVTRNATEAANLVAYSVSNSSTAPGSPANRAPERSFRQIGRHLGVSDHTARNLVDRAQAELRRLIG